MTKVIKQALVTGASSDIGLALCKKYLSEGWNVIGHYRTERAELLALNGPHFKTWKCDFARLSIKTFLVHALLSKRAIFEGRLKYMRYSV